MRQVIAMLFGYGLAGAAAAQAPGVLQLEGGFTPDPAVVELAVTGDTGAEGFVRGCPGAIAATEGLTVNLVAPSAALRFYVHGEQVVGLVARAPDGIFRCAAVDDDGIAQVVMERALAGGYTLWPAVAAAGVATDARLSVSEQELSAFDVLPFDVPTAATLEPARLGEVAFATPLETGAQVLVEDALAGATVAAERLVADCAGGVDPGRADLTVTLAEPLPALTLYAESIEDTVLLVLDPDGGWWCVDDASGANPAVTVQPAPAGRYQVLVGSFSETGGTPFVLSATTGEPQWREPESPGGEAPLLGVDAEPAAGRIDLPPEGETEVPVVLATGVGALAYDDACYGDIDPGRPHVVLSVADESANAYLRVTSTADTTLLVVSPSGDILCSDDAIGLDPVVALEPAAAGDYVVWVGQAGGDAGATASLHVSREPPAEEAATAAGGFTPDELSVLVGRDFQTALDVLAILSLETSLGQALHYERAEARGTEGFVLHDVVLNDPTGEQPPTPVQRIVVDHLDLEGLRAHGQPGRFSLAIEGVDYATLATGAHDRTHGLLPLVGDGAQMSLSASLLPVEGDAARMRATLGAGIDSHVALNVVMTGRFADDLPSADRTPDNLLSEALDVELLTHGFLGRVLAAMAADEGRDAETMKSEMLASLRELLAPVEAGGFRAQLLDAVTAAFGNAEGNGVLRLRLQASDAQSIDALTMHLLEAEPGDSEAIRLGAEYETLP